MADGTEPATGRSGYPWYDAVWLATYTEAKAVIARMHPAELAGFIDALSVFETRRDYEATLLDKVFDDALMEEIRGVVASLSPSDLELHEARSFGRFVVHDHPFFTELQHRVVPLVSKVVGERVEVSYNFLSMYSRKGVCALHMDSPQAKWTLDLCLDQSAPWPIHVSDVQPWPETSGGGWAEATDWEAEIKRAQHFRSFEPEPGQAVVFSGSSQWHYRDAIPQADVRSFCDLLFFHFVPEGTRELVDPRNWAQLFDIPELALLAPSD